VRRPVEPVPAAARPPGVLRLCVIFHESEALGAGLSVLRAVPELARYGWTVSGLFPGPGPLFDQAEDVLSERISVPKPLAFSLRGWRAEPPGTRQRVAAARAYFREVRRALLRLRPHVVHANTLLSLPEAGVARMLGLPLVFQAHELPPPGLKRDLGVRLAARLADLLVGVSRPVSAMLERGAGTVPVATIHNGVPAQPAEAIPERGAPVVVGTVGTVDPRKGTDLFLQSAALALERRPALRFEHIGRFGLTPHTAWEHRVRRLAGAPPLAAALRLGGAGSVQEALRRWTIFVLPSRQDPFPLATLEAMAAGLPVIAADVGGLSEQIEHLRTGILVPPDDPEAIARWVVRLADDPELRLRLGASAAAHVRAFFTLERQARELHEVYLRALNRRHAPSALRWTGRLRRV